ncbi:MAG: FtsX-like permease family protein [Treponemataceae bacterium]|nr:FtsX-like permease family protein [Treponemataceae bacterium]
MKNIILLSYRLNKANRKDTRLIRFLITFVFSIILVFTNALFSSFETNITSSTICNPDFIMSGKASKYMLSNNGDLRKLCIPQEQLTKIYTHFDVMYDIHEGYSFYTYISQIDSTKNEKTLVTITDYDVFCAKIVRQIDNTSYKNRRSVNIFVNESFFKLFDENAEFLISFNDYNTDMTRLRLSVCGVIESKTSAGNGIPEIYISLENIKEFFSIPKTYSFPVFVYNKNAGNMKLFSPSYLILKNRLEKYCAKNNMSLQPYYYVDKEKRDTFDFYITIVTTLEILIIMILIYTLMVCNSISYNKRKKDFMVFKAFGCTKNELFLTIFLENLYICFKAYIIALILSFIVGLFANNLYFAGIVLNLQFSWPGFIAVTVFFILTSISSIIKSCLSLSKQKITQGDR